MILPDTTFENCPPLDVICIGGGLGQMAVVDDGEVLDFLRQQSHVKLITSVCGGSEFLAKASRIAFVNEKSAMSGLPHGPYTVKNLSPVVGTLNRCL